jgi:hypothetical protein
VTESMWAGAPVLRPTVIRGDSNTAVTLAKGPRLTRDSRGEQTGIQYYYICCNAFSCATRGSLLRN